MLFRTSPLKRQIPNPLLSLYAAFSSLTITEGLPTKDIILRLLRQCKSQIQASLVHQQVLSRGLMERFSISLCSTYLALHAYSGAALLLQSASPSPRQVYQWNAIIRRAVSTSHLTRSLSLYVQMKRLAWSPDEFTFPFVLKACGSSYGTGASLHADVVAFGYEGNVYVCNALVSLYGRCGASGHAGKVFDEMRERRIVDLASWNSVVSSYAQCGEPFTAIRVFREMIEIGDFELSPDGISLVNVLPACALTSAWKIGKEIHGFAVRSGLIENMFVGNSVVDLYAKWGKMVDAEKVFDRMTTKDVVTWNSMVAGYSQLGRVDDAVERLEKMRKKVDLDVVSWTSVISGCAQRGLGDQALVIFRQMLSSSCLPSRVTLMSCLSACAMIGSLRTGKEIHGYSLRNTLYDDVAIGLIDMYAKCKRIESAETLFETVGPDDRDVVTWTVMIGGQAQHGEASEALRLFASMVAEATPNDHTISCALLACTRLGSLRCGRELHAYITRRRYSAVVFVVNCLIDMYSKSGDLRAARTVFERMSERNEVSWTSLITGYGIHGRGEEALKMFEEMKRLGVLCDGVTYLTVLHACNHSGMADAGVRLFDEMKSLKVGIEEEHYACMVDLLGRAGRIREAKGIIGEMPGEISAIIWATLLGSCRIHGEIEEGEQAAEKLNQIEFQSDGTLTILSNIYASSNRWRDVARVRVAMKRRGIRKRPGCSWLEEKGGFVSFFAGDRSHAMAGEIWGFLGDLMEKIRAMGYVPETRFALHDVDEEEKGELLAEHSEKLALAYGILTTAPGATIRIVKNLRVCGDCHEAILYVSRIVESEIVLRDSSRFHHFKNGVCSCRGYW